MSGNSRNKIAVTIKMDVKEYRKKWKNLRGKYVCHNKEWGPWREKIPPFHFFLSASTTYKTPGHAQAVNNT